MPNFLFVYGTLHPECAPAEVAEVVRGFTSVGRGVVRGQLYRFAEYPAVELGASLGARVRGEVFRVEGEAVWERLDAYEGFDPERQGTSLFRRRRVWVRMATGGAVRAWVYEYGGRLPMSAGKAVSRKRKTSAGRRSLRGSGRGI